MAESGFEYDFIIVGSGLFGSVCARELTDNGFKCLVLEKRNHIGGNCYTENIEGINVHKYGPHIFHTNSKRIWDYVNKYAAFNRFTYMPVANFKGDLFNLPFNMNTFYQLWKVKTPQEAQDKIQHQISKLDNKNLKNLEDYAINSVGHDVYEKLIKGYTEKQWGRDAKDLPTSIIKRLPVRFTFDNNYFNDAYQGIPIGGYTKLIKSLLTGIEIRRNVDYFLNKNQWNALGNKTIFTGKIDEYFDFKLGHLEYRSLLFETVRLEVKNFQGNAVINYTEKDVPYNRIIEHKHFEFGQQPFTIITKEYPKEWKSENDAYYPINDVKNMRIYKKYKEMAKHENRTIFGGRLAEYKYYNMDQVIASALKSVTNILSANV